MEQRAFYEHVLHPLMKRAASGKIALLFLDAAHFVMGMGFLGYVYGKVRRFVGTYSGRKRYNVLGALDYVTKKVHVVTNDKYISATEVCEMLHRLGETYAGKEIHLVLDNARYQKCELAQATAKELGIHLEYIPPYSPNLNLIERMWKFVKGSLRTRYYDDFGEFCKRIDDIIASTAVENKVLLDKLIGEKVQLFDDRELLWENTFCLCKGTQKIAI